MKRRWLGWVAPAVLRGAGLMAGLAALGTSGGEESNPLSAKEGSVPSGEERGDHLEPLWEFLESDDWSTLYKSKKGPVDEWNLLGRFDLQFGHLDSDRGDADHFEIRRLRVGTSVEFLDDWRVKFVADMTDDNEVRYGAINTAYLRYKLTDDLKLKVGKQVPHFSQEWSTPSMDLGVIERSLLVEQVRPRRAVGFNMEGDWNDLSYEAGVFSGHRNREFGSFDAGLFYVAGLSYDLTEVFDWWKDFDLQFSYMYNDGDLGNNAVDPYRHAFSTGINLRKKRFRLTAEALCADGLQGRPDAWGFLVTPSWEVIDDTLDLVFRYHYAKGDGRDGLRSRSRYERMAPALTDRGRGEEYQSAYLGLNYHLIEDRLVFMTGGEWKEMQDTFGDGGDLNGFSLLSALRFSF